MLRKSLGLFIGMCYSSFLLASGASQELSGTLAAYKTFSAIFSQKTFTANGRLISSAKGKFWLSRPNRFRWNALSPNKQMIVGDGQYVWIYDVDLMQVTKQPFVNRGQSPINILISDAKTLTSHYRVEKKTMIDGQVQYRLTAKAENSSLRGIQLFFKKGLLTAMALDNNLGQHSVFSFSGMALNSRIASSVFRFRVPKGVDVINNQGGM